MTLDHQTSNRESWLKLENFVETREENANARWKAAAKRFLGLCFSAHLNHYFRAGHSMFDLLFSTLKHHGIGDEPCVKVAFLPGEQIRVTFIQSHMPQLVEYVLPFDAGFQTFRRFLNQLWTSTMPEGIPSDLRGIVAPVLFPPESESARGRLN